MKNKAPKIIWLQVGEGQEGEERTWNQDKINDSDVKYSRVEDKPK